MPEYKIETRLDCVDPKQSSGVFLRDDVGAYAIPDEVIRNVFLGLSPVAKRNTTTRNRPFTT